MREHELLRKLVDAILKTPPEWGVEENPYPYALGYHEVAVQTLLIENEVLKDTVKLLDKRIEELTTSRSRGG